MARGAWIMALLGTLLFAAGALAQTTEPAAAAAASGAANSRAVAPAGPYEDLPIGRSHGGGAPAARTGVSGSPQNAIGWPRLLMALAAVLALIFLLKAILKRLSGGGGLRSSKAVQVLSTQNLAPRQQLVLVRLGRRLVLIGNTGTAMNALCEISEPDEVAALLGQLSVEKSGPAARTFGAFMGRASRAGERKERPAHHDDHADADGDLEDDPRPAAPSAPNIRAANADELSGLLEKVRTLTQQYER